MQKEQTYDLKLFAEATREMQIAKTSSHLWLAKTREFEELTRDAKVDLSFLYKRRATAPAEQLWYHDLIIEKEQIRLKEYELQLRKFSFYHHQALGHKMPESFDLDALKSISPKLLLGEPVTESGKLLTYKCPFHNEKHASFVWYRKTNKGHCFGCNMNADIIDLFKHLNNCDFKTACNELKGLL